MTKTVEYVIQARNGTYYQGWTAISPRFGGTLVQAKRFKSIAEAISEERDHYAFVLTDLIELRSVNVVAA